jgi:outer membrane receptor for ferrienterochelin and colicins
MGARALIFACAFALASTFTRAPLATEADEARFFDEVARRAYDARDYKRALEAFWLVHEIAPSPRSLFNIAVCAELGGKHDVAFAMYREYLAEGDPDAARRNEAEARATRLESKLALLEITSDPPGASIYIDRTDLGLYGVTPRTIVVGDGERQVMLELPGHRTEILPAVAKAGTPVRLQVSLKPHLGELAVEVTPANAELEFLRDDKPVAAERVARGYRLPVGSYLVVARAAGYTVARGRAVVRQGETARLALGLAPLPRPTGRLLVSAGKVEADVYVDGRRVAVTPATLPGLNVGAHVVEVRAGSRSVKRTVNIGAGRPTYVEVDLTKGRQ